MCGINGIMKFNQSSEIYDFSRIVNRMNCSIIHRGPDSDGFFYSENIGLGMRRLSIIDLDTGSQPIYNEERNKVIVFNGEIYNYKELYVKLVEKGHTFSTLSDTEVILHLYEEYSEGCLTHLDGMFAFAIYDLELKSLFIARDRVGEKPLYYFRNDDIILFASELKSILNSELVQREINLYAFSQYLQLTYIPSPLTIYDNIYKLEAGNYMTIKNSGELFINQYWDYDLTCDKISDYNESKELLRKNLFDSVEKRMRADVPLGAFLSGGIDSTIIVGIMSRLSKKPIETFTIGFNIKDYDERDRAKLVSKYHNTNHHEYLLEFEEILGLLDNIIAKFDEPFADSSALPTYIVSRYASKHVKVVLTGDAGDELFAGYSKYLINYYSHKYTKIPKFIRKFILERIINILPDKNSISRKIRKVISYAEYDSFTKRKELMCLGFKGNELSELLNEKVFLANELEFIRKFYDKQPKLSDLERALYTDFKVVLEGDMLKKVDSMSMLNSIETRVPMLSTGMLDTSTNIKVDYKLKGRNKKYILKDTFSDLIPKKLLRATKKGFGVPLDYWFRGPLKSEFKRLTNRQLIEKQGLFNHDYINKIYNEHCSMKKNRKGELWTIFVFQKWYEREFLR
ncbi:asparagine synthase (glutamine-hydrolyzing) [Mycoplasmatota bacterium]|nr:asparagine synthase (glutamine-hydrolyzing) [Mycoplasmatota bacterium]